MSCLIELWSYYSFCPSVLPLQAIGQVLYLRPYANDFSTQWVVTSVTLLTLGSVFTTYIGEQISDLKLGNGTSLLIFTSIISYLPASFGRTAAQAFQDGNYVGLIATIVSFVLLVLSIVYVQVNAAYILFNKDVLGIKEMLTIWSTKGFRKQRGKFHLTMPRDTPVKVEGFKNLLTYPLRSGLCSIFMPYVSVVLEF